MWGGALSVSAAGMVVVVVVVVGGLSDVLGSMVACPLSAELGQTVVPFYV